MWWHERFGLDGSSPVNRPPLPLAFAQKPRDKANFTIHKIGTPGQAGYTC